MSKKDSGKKKPSVHEELKPFNIYVDEFGEIKTSYKIDDINKFLNKNVEDKKLKNRTDLQDDEEDTESEQ